VLVVLVVLHPEPDTAKRGARQPGDIGPGLAARMVPEELSEQLRHDGGIHAPTGGEGSKYGLLLREKNSHQDEAVARVWLDFPPVALSGARVLVVAEAR